MDTVNHILLRKAQKTKINTDNIIKYGYYDSNIGAWVANGGKELLVDRPDRDKPRTKKNDVETGEDLKSE